MKSFQTLFLCMSFCVALHLHHPTPASAHGTGYRLINDARTVAVSFFYADGQPMSYAETLVFGPDNDDIEFQNGRTDQNGRFAFYPETPGTWRLVVNDGMGHRAEGIIAVKAPAENAAESGAVGGDETPATRSDVQAEIPEHSHTGLKLIAGLSLIGNLCFAGFYFKNRRSGEGASRR
jgi:nickel transport protein